MIETISDYQQFLAENILNGNLIVHIVPVEDGIHPADNSPCIIFIKNILSGKIYYYSFNHPDSKSCISNSLFLRDGLSKFKNRLWAINGKAFNQLFPVLKIYDVNLCNFLENAEVIDLDEFETSAHKFVRNNCKGFGQVNKSIPLLKHKESFSDMCESVEKIICKFNIDDSYLQFNNIIQVLGKIESNGIFVDTELFKKHFDSIPNKNGLMFSEYNVYTSTGRPSNRYGGVNYAALNHTDGSRNCFVSRYGDDGRIVVIDYSAFHPRIICSLTNYPIPNSVDLYEYLAKLYFQKKDVDETDIDNAKKLTFKQLYGGVDDKYSHIKYLSNLKNYINEQWEFFKKHNYIETPFFKRKITDKHIKDPNPTKLFNYILQAAEGEIAIPRIDEVIKCLINKRTKAISYTYDAVMYDFHKEDGIETLNKIRTIMSNNGIYPLKTYIGNSYQDIRFIDI